MTLHRFSTDLQGVEGSVKGFSTNSAPSPTSRKGFRSLSSQLRGSFSSMRSANAGASRTASCSTHVRAALSSPKSNFDIVRKRTSNSSNSTFLSSRFCFRSGSLLDAKFADGSTRKNSSPKSQRFARTRWTH